MAERPSMPHLKIDLPELAEVVATVGYIPPCLAAIMAEIHFELLSHARLGILKDAAANFPSRRTAQQALAAAIHRYGRKTPNPIDLEDAVGEIFMAGGPFGDGDIYRQWEFGADINTTTPMAVPIGAARRNRGTMVRFRELLEARAFGVIRRPGRAALLVTHHGEGPAERGTRNRAARTEVWGVLTRRRKQRPLLTFRARVQSSFDKRKSEYDRAVEMALTQAGRAALTERLGNAEGRRSAFSAAFNAERAKQLALGIPKRKAKQAAIVAGNAAKRAFALRRDA